MTAPIKYFMVTEDPSTDTFYTRIGFERVRSLEHADFIQFNGGVDVFPMLYGQYPYNNLFNGYSFNRDFNEKSFFHQTIDKPKIGICRGAQFLHVMNGGTLWQDVDNHEGRSHGAILIAPNGEKEITVNSSHHQMMRPDSKQEFTILGYAVNVSTRKATYDMVHNTPFVVYNDIVDIEALWYPNTHSFCFQPHPEWSTASKQMEDYFINTIYEVV
jgi:gamma-glutamyl-gamma-aminobutyrate hydrolase PuuD